MGIAVFPFQAALKELNPQGKPMSRIMFVIDQHRFGPQLWSHSPPSAGSDADASYYLQQSSESDALSAETDVDDETQAEMGSGN